MKYAFLLLLTIFTSIGCKSVKKTSMPAGSTITPPAADVTEVKRDSVVVYNSDAEQIRKIVDNINTDFQSATMTGSMLMENSTDRYNFNFNIRMIKDSVIWMQLKKIGLEGARLLIRKDSLFLVDRIHRSYLKMSWPQVRRQLNGPVDFHTLYSVLTGNVSILDGGRDTLSTTENMKWIYSADDNNRIVIGLNAVFNTLTSYTIQDLKKNNLIQIRMDNHKIIYDKKYFSYLRDLEIFSNNAKLLYINFSFDEVKRNVKVNLPFEIPSSYKPMEI